MRIDEEVREVSCNLGNMFGPQYANNEVPSYLCTSHVKGGGGGGGVGSR